MDRVVCYAAILVAIFVLTSCKPRQATELASLTPEERELCEFKGRRFILVLNPAPEFGTTADIARSLFAADLSDSATGNDTLVKPSFLAEKIKHDQAKADACRRYLADSMSKYTEVRAPEGTRLTADAARAAVASLSASIKALREKWQTEYSVKPTPEIQVLIVIVGHGINKGFTTDGYLSFSGPSAYLFSEFAKDMWTHMLTQCSASGIKGRSCNQVPDAERRADELMIIANNCFSGNLADRVIKHTYNQDYPKLSKGQSTSASRIYAMSTASSQQVGWAVNGEIQLLSALSEAIRDQNGSKYDGDPWSVSLFDARAYVQHTAYARGFTHIYNSMKTALLAPLICGTDNKRASTVQSMRDNGLYFAKLFKEPDSLVKSDVSNVSGKSNDDTTQLTISSPQVQTNMDDAMLKDYWLATTGGIDGQTEDGKYLEDRYTKNDAELRAMMGARVEVLEKVYAAVLANVTTTPATMNLPNPYAMPQEKDKNSFSRLAAPGGTSTNISNGINQPPPAYLAPEKFKFSSSMAADDYKLLHATCNDLGVESGEGAP